MLLRKSVYPDGYIAEWENIHETLWPVKEEFYSNLNMEDITDARYMHIKTVFKDFYYISKVID